MLQLGIAGADLPVIEPDAQPVRSQPFLEPPYPRLVRSFAAEENVVFEIVCHTRFC